MTQKSRTTIYQAFEPLLGEVATEEMLAQFPSRDLDQPVTVAHLSAEMADLRTEMRTEMADLRTDLRTEIADLRTDLRTEIADLRADLRAEMHDVGRTTVMWLVGTQATFLAVVVAIVALLQ